MLINKNFSPRNIIAFAGHHFMWLIPLVLGVAALQEYTKWDWTKMPFQPIALIGTAVAFYLGFKNNQSYGRLWEARKVWGAIVNSSRAWGSTLKGFVSNLHAKKSVDEIEQNKIIRTMVYRHIAWLYALRSQLLIPTEWEHISQRGLVGRFAKLRRRRFGVGLLDDEITKEELTTFLDPTELGELMKNKNMATQLIDRQTADLKQARQDGLIDDFRHMELQKILYDFYIHQGKLERIKKFPLPRQYGSMSFIFVGIFIALLPFGMLPLFDQSEPVARILAVPLTALVAWVYLVMELVGDYSENPFEGTANDIPMHSLCRTIEIDLREMLGETDLPPAIKPKRGVLM
jgi:putative membrane protein